MVDHIYDDSSYILWLTDYGYAVHSYKNTIRKLKKQFQLPETFGNVIKVGVANVLPATCKYDFVTTNLEKEIVDTWNETAIDNVKKLLQDAVTISFEKRLCRTGDHLFGKVLVETSEGIVVDLANSLVYSPFAMKTKRTTEFSNKLKTFPAVDIKRFQNIWDESRCIPGAISETSGQNDEETIQTKSHRKEIPKVISIQHSESENGDKRDKLMIPDKSECVLKVKKRIKKKVPSHKEMTSQTPKKDRIRTPVVKSEIKLSETTDDSADLPIQKVILPKHDVKPESDQKFIIHKPDLRPEPREMFLESGSVLQPPPRLPKPDTLESFEDPILERFNTTTEEIAKTSTLVPTKAPKSLSQYLPNRVTEIEPHNPDLIEKPQCLDLKLQFTPKYNFSGKLEPQTSDERSATPPPKPNINNSPKALAPLPKAVTVEAVEESFYQRMSRITGEKLIKPSQPAKPTTPRTISFMPAGYDQVLSQEQRTRKSFLKVSGLKHTNPEIKRVNPEMIEKPKFSNRQPTFAAKNLVMEKLDETLALERKDKEKKKESSIEVPSTSDDGSLIRAPSANVVLSNNEVPIGAINRFEEV